MCGIVGIYVQPTESVMPLLVNAMTLLQHRGQDAAGVAVVSTTPLPSEDRLSSTEVNTEDMSVQYSSSLHMHRNIGQVSDVFAAKQVCTSLTGNLGIGHVRYPTAGNGGSDVSEAQPFYTNYPYGIALVHNGNLTNTQDLRARMHRARRHLNTESDSELLLNLFAEEMVKQVNNAENGEDGYTGEETVVASILHAIRSVMLTCQGGFAVVILIHGIGIFAFRDPFGIRPLSIGISNEVGEDQLDEVCTEGLAEYIIASESVAIEALDAGRFKLLRDLNPGEVVTIHYDGRCAFHTVLNEDDRLDVEGNPHYCLRPCLFEYVYFARPDSVSFFHLFCPDFDLFDHLLLLDSRRSTCTRSQS